MENIIKQRDELIDKINLLKYKLNDIEYKIKMDNYTERLNTSSRLIDLGNGRMKLELYRKITKGI